MNKLTKKMNKDRVRLLFRILLLAIADSLLIFAAQYLALFLRFEFDFAAVEESGFLNSLFAIIRIQIPLTILVFALFGLYTSLWAFAGLGEAIRICIASVLVSVVQYFLMRIMNLPIPRTFPILNIMLLAIFTCFLRFSYRIVRAIRHKSANKSRRTLVVGAGAASAAAIQDLRNSEYSRNKVICIVDDDPAKIGRRLHDIPILGNRNDIPTLVERKHIEEIILAIPSATATQRREIAQICEQTGCETKVLPSIAQIASGHLDVRQIRKIQIEDLLGRDSVKVDTDEIGRYVEGKVVMVTGGGGSIGSELCRQIAAHKPKLLIIFDIFENGAYSIQQELRHKHPELNLEVLIGSIRDQRRLDDIFSTYRPQIVYHAAAHKHVPLMENNPREAVKNNVFGTRNLCRSASMFGTEIFVQISTDKAVNPTNVMGATKRICEMIVQAYSRNSKTRFVCVRFGNVLGSNGSVIPLFRRQIEHGGPVTVTHKDIIRYFMTIPEAVSLVLQAGVYAHNGEIFILDMGEPIRIDDLARNMIRLSGYEPDVDIKIEYTGLRPGEKLYEELLMGEEGIRSTANHLIFIGNPLEFDESNFFTQLEALEAACTDSESDIRSLLQEIVPTYHPKYNG